MSDPYSEATRYDRRRLSPLARIMLILAGCFAVGLTTLVVVGMLVVRKASEVAAEYHEDPAETIAEMAEFFAGDVTVVETDVEDEQVTLRFGDGGELVTVDLAQAVEQALEGIRFEGEADESGGRLSFQTSDGETRIELRGNDDGGFLHISSPDGDVLFGAGDEAADLPDWVPVYPGARVKDQLFSKRTETGRAGAVALTTEASAGDVVAWYADALEDEGFESVVVKGSRGDRGHLEVTSGRDGERKLSVVAGRDHDGSGTIVLFYHEAD